MDKEHVFKIGDFATVIKSTNDHDLIEGTVVRFAKRSIHRFNSYCKRDSNSM